MRRRGVGLLVGVLQSGCGGCDRVNVNVDVDAALEIDSPSIEIDAPPPRCDPSKPFGTPTLAAEISTGQFEDGGFLTADGLTIYFGSYRPGGLGLYDIYMATRPSGAEPFSTPVPVPGINTALDEHGATLTSDGLTIYVSRYTTGNGFADWDILTSTRNSVADTFPPLQRDSFFNGPKSDSGVFLLPDRTAIWSSDRTFPADSYLAAWTGTAYSAPVAISTLGISDAPNAAGTVAMRPDKLAAYFVTSRGGAVNGPDIWIATRTDPTQPFTTFARVEELSRPDEGDYLSMVTPDDCEAVMTRFMPGPTSDIYLAIKPL